MNLWTVYDNGEPFDGQEAILVWAWGADEARQVASENCEYEPTPPEEFRTRINGMTSYSPRLGVPHTERRCAAMRECGWREESDELCEECDLYAMGLVTFCHECYLCGDCCRCESEAGS